MKQNENRRPPFQSEPAVRQNRQFERSYDECRRREPAPAPVEGQSLICEFIQALAEEIAAIKKGRGGSTITVYDGAFIRRDGPLFVYVFTTESPLIVMDDAPAEIEVGGQKFPGQIISMQGSEVAVGIENDFGKTIAQARLITNLWYLLEALRKRYEEVLSGQLTLDTRLARQIFGLAPATVGSDSGDLNLPPSPCLLNEEQITAIRAVCGSDVHYIWGPPGTGKTQTIGFLIAALVRRNLRVLVVSHTNVATDHAIGNAAQLLLDSEDYQGGKLVRFGNISPNVHLPDIVIPDRIVERLGQSLKQTLESLQTELARVQSQLTSLQGVEAVLGRRNRAVVKLSELDVNLRRCSQEHDSAKSRQDSLSAQSQQAKAKLLKAQAAGKVKRLFLGMDPVRLQVQVANIEAELAVAERSVAAGASKLGELRASLGSALSDAQRYAPEGQALLSKYGLDQIALSARIGQLSKQAEGDALAIRAVEAELQALSSKILSQAKVIATTLTKATISKQIDNQKFDVLVLDEASMAPMPSVFFAAARATQKAVAVGDFRQLPPICIARDEMAQRWLGRDIFDQSGIQRAVDDQKPERRLTMLRRQYRMHPDISSIPNIIIYEHRLRDCLAEGTLQEIQATLQKSPFAHSPLVLYDLSSTNPWSSHLNQGGRYNLYSAVLSAEVAKRTAQVGVESVGVISPYAVQARLIKMILDDSGDTRLRHLKVSTVHKFQGLEQDVIIFDVAEGPMPRYGPSGLVDGVELASQAAKLINVSITRPKGQLAIVANLQYLASKLRRDSILLRVLDQLRRRGTVVDSREVVNDYLCSEFDRWARLLNPRDDGINADGGTLYTERNFYGAFFTDLRGASREIIIVSPFLTASRAQHFFDLFRSKLREGIEVRVFTRTLHEQQGDMFRQAEMVLEELNRAGVQVVERKGLHQKFAFIDRQIAWEGSLNILSQSEGRSTEHMRRLTFPKTCNELIDLHNFGSDTEVDPGSRRPIQTDRTCDKCGSGMVLRPGQYGAFLGCSAYPKCENPKAILRGDSVATDVICPGTDGSACGRHMVATKGRYGVYLRCSDLNCKATRNING